MLHLRNKYPENQRKMGALTKADMGNWMSISIKSNINKKKDYKNLRKKNYEGKTF